MIKFDKVRWMAKGIVPFYGQHFGELCFSTTQTLSKCSCNLTFCESKDSNDWAALLIFVTCKICPRRSPDITITSEPFFIGGAGVTQARSISPSRLIDFMSVQNAVTLEGGWVPTKSKGNFVVARRPSKDPFWNFWLNLRRTCLSPRFFQIESARNDDGSTGGGVEAQSSTESSGVAPQSGPSPSSGMGVGNRGASDWDDRDDFSADNGSMPLSTNATFCPSSLQNEKI